MPTIFVIREDFYRHLGKEMTDEEFEDLCFQFGIELDDVTSEKEIVAREQGAEAAMGKDDTVQYKIEIPANRYDLLCLEGLVQSLKVFLGIGEIPSFSLVPSGSPIVINVDPATEQVRRYVVGAVLRNVTFTKASLRRFLDLQDKLHQNICRKRSLVAIGTHDLDTVQPPFLYTAKPPEEIKFQALFEDSEKTAVELMEIYRKKPTMKEYVPIIENSPVYPIIYDTNGVVLSMPPMINGVHSQLTENTKNVFIDTTATDLHKAEIVLNMLVAALSEHCDKQFTVEPIQVVYTDTTRQHPDFTTRSVQVSTQYVNSLIGISLETQEMIKILNKMGLGSEQEGDESFKVTVPITRSDILHPCDIAEDVAIAYGYNNIVRSYPKTPTVGEQQPLNSMTDLLRREAAQAGYCEVLTFSLISIKDNYTKMRRDEDGLAVQIKNPTNSELQMPRTTLLPGLLKTTAINVAEGLPLKFFELSDVVVMDKNSDVGARNLRKLSAVYCNSVAEIEELHGLIDIVMGKLGLSWPEDYCLVEGNNPSFLEGRQAQIKVSDTVIGVFGAVHPEVLDNFDLKFPATAFEFDLETLISFGKI